MRAADVHVGEVRRVGFVHVEVYFEEGSVGLRNDRLEESMRRYRCGLEEDLVPVGFEEAELHLNVSLGPTNHTGPLPASERTCQTKGRFLKFIRANRIANILHTPPGAFTPVHLASTLR